MYIVLELGRMLKALEAIGLLETCVMTKPRT